MGANVADGSKAAVAIRFGHVRFTLIADIGCGTSDVRSVLPAQPVDATPILNRRDRDDVLMSEKCRQGLTAAEKPELWHRWQPGILKAIRRAFGKRYAGVASTG